MYISTRGGERLPASKAIIKGLACDGGLFLPEKIEKIDVKAALYKTYCEIAEEVFKIFFDDFTPDEIKYCVSSAYNADNFRDEIARVKNFGNVSFLELWHGPTLAFKDMALTALPYLIEVAKKKNGVSDKSLTLVATSGDTGGAALSSFMKNPAFSTIVVYPRGGVSEIQEKQMLYYSDEKTSAYAYNGNFDDCQNLVKDIFSKYPENNGVSLISANSINIGRLVPQVVYYVYAYSECLKKGYINDGEKLSVCVPTGNFGDIFAAYLAREAGVPIGKFICASNVNNVLTDFFESGVYDRKREFKKSNSPAMDILVSSNLERLLYYAENKNAAAVSEYMNGLKNAGKFKINENSRKNLTDFSAAYSTEEETVKAIKKAYDELRYLIDPHTAVAYDCYNKLKVKEKTLIVSTASPYKFPETVSEAIGLNKRKSEFLLIRDIARTVGEKVPYGIKKLEKSVKKPCVISEAELREAVLMKRNAVQVTVPCTTANLGSAFDSAGMALSLENSFLFERCEKDDTDGNESDNLILKAYKRVFEKSCGEYIPVKITEIKNEVPCARGLGSSATCVVAGVLAANYFLKDVYSRNELLRFMTDVEGHPDNVAPAFLGGLVSAVDLKDKIIAVREKVFKKLKIFALIPDFELSTAKSRKALKKEYTLKEVTYNLSRAAILSRAMETGNMNLIKEAVKDCIHEPYRYPLIKGGYEMKAAAEKLGYAVAVSGAGPALIAFGYGNGFKKEMIKNGGGAKWEIKELKVINKGATINGK